MSQYRRAFITVLLSGSAMSLSLFLASSVEARTVSNAPAPTRHISSQREFWAENDLTLQAGGAGTPDGQPLPEGEGKELTQKKCTSCHASTVWSTKHYTQDQWASVIDQMVEKGMTASDDEIETITKYLAANFGPGKKDAPASPPPAQ
jgi:cytochrome c5